MQKWQAKELHSTSEKKTLSYVRIHMNIAVFFWLWENNDCEQGALLREMFCVAHIILWPHFFNHTSDLPISFKTIFRPSFPRLLPVITITLFMNMLFVFLHENPCFFFFIFLFISHLFGRFSWNGESVNRNKQTEMFATIWIHTYTPNERETTTISTAVAHTHTTKSPIKNRESKDESEIEKEREKKNKSPKTWKNFFNFNRN